jgi:hypothetical protein
MGTHTGGVEGEKPVEDRPVRSRKRQRGATPSPSRDYAVVDVSHPAGVLRALTGTSRRVSPATQRVRIVRTSYVPILERLVAFSAGLVLEVRYTSRVTTTGWKRELLPPKLTFLCVRRDARGRLFAGGYDGIWMRDAAGAWAACPLRGKHGYATFVHDLASADGMLYAISTNGTVHSSSVGARWTGRKSGIKHHGLRVIGLGGGRVVAFGEYGLVRIGLH